MSLPAVYSFNLVIEYDTKGTPPIFVLYVDRCVQFPQLGNELNIIIALQGTEERTLHSDIDFALQLQ